MEKKKDQPVAVAPSPETDDELRSQAELAELYWRAAERIGARNSHLDPDEELGFITEVVEEFRREGYEREQREAANHR